MGSNQYRVVTDGQTDEHQDRITLAKHAIACIVYTLCVLPRVKTEVDGRVKFGSLVYIAK